MKLMACYALIVAGCLQISGCANTQPINTPITNQPLSALPNLHHLRNRLYSGGEPKGVEGYQALSSLGFNAVISVDAVAPNQTLADEFGIKVVHLPIGYDGISNQRTIELAYAIHSLPRPIYLHCHQGKHRGPTALCVGAIGTGEIDHLRANEFMIQVGTSASYPGLWAAATNAQPLNDSDLNNATIRLPARSPIDDFEHAMAEIDRLNELLWLCAENNFSAPEDHPDLAPASLAGEIHNLLRSLETDPLVEREGIIFEEHLADSIALASDLESQIAKGNYHRASMAMNTLEESCMSCHERFRD